MNLYRNLVIAMLALPCALWAEETGAEGESPVFQIHSPAETAAHNETVLDISFDTRIDFQNQWQKGHTDGALSGFKGQYFMFSVSGSIMDGLVDYSWRQRINRRKNDSSAFDDTDWVWVRANYKGWHISGGKEVVLIGGWEYERNPLDLYSASVFWNNVPCYEFGLTVSCDLGPSDNLAFQAIQSPWHTPERNNMYGYNLLWSGKHGIFSSLWSANLFEYLPGRYISYISLGNKFDVRNVTFELDLVNRAASGQAYFFKDFSVMAELAWRPRDRWRTFVKYTHDANHSGTDRDFTVADGTSLNLVGAGVEFEILKRRSHRLRLHAACFHRWGRYEGSDGYLQPGGTFLSVGARWHVDVFRIKAK